MIVLSFKHSRFLFEYQNTDPQDSTAILKYTCGSTWEFCNFNVYDPVSSPGGCHCVDTIQIKVKHNIYLVALVTNLAMIAILTGMFYILKLNRLTDGFKPKLFNRLITTRVKYKLLCCTLIPVNSHKTALRT